MFKEKKIIIQPYGARLILIESDSKKLVKKYFKKIDFDFDELPYCHALSGHTIENNKEYQCFYIVLSRSHPLAKLTVGGIAHECLHIINYLCGYIGINYDINNDEAVTYLIGWLVDEVCNFLEFENIVKKKRKCKKENI